MKSYNVRLRKEYVDHIVDKSVKIASTYTANQFVVLESFEVKPGEVISLQDFKVNFAVEDGIYDALSIDADVLLSIREKFDDDKYERKLIGVREGSSYASLKTTDTVSDYPTLWIRSITMANSFDVMLALSEGISADANLNISYVKKYYKA